MRVILATAASLALATNATAQTAPDRYGPPRAGVQTASAASALAYGGRMLTWANKAAPAATAVGAATAPAQPVAETRPAPTPRAHHLGEIAPAAPGADRPSTLPASLYDTPSPPAAAIAQPRPAAPAPQRMAAAPAAPAYAGAPSRLYSLHREYGMSPDPTPPAAGGAGYVLIGPPAAEPGRDAAGETSDRPY